MYEARQSVCSKHDIPRVRSRTFLVFEARHSLCSKQDIPCVRSKTFLVFEAGHSLCSKQDISGVRSTNFNGLNNREDSSDFDDLLTKSIASARSSFERFRVVGKFFASTRNVRGERTNEGTNEQKCQKSFPPVHPVSIH